MTVKYVIKELLTHDSGAGCSVLSKDVLEKIIEPDLNILKPTTNLIDASGNIMDVVGTVLLPVKVIGTKTAKLVEFCVVNSSYSFILLGRNFMKLYRMVTFDFYNSKIMLGDYCCDGVKLNKKQAVRVNQITVIPARSEKPVLVGCNMAHVVHGCNKINGLIAGDFEAKLFGIDNIHVTRARVSPNLDGVFYITMLNVSNQDIEISSRKLIGYVHPTGEILAEIKSNNNIISTPVQFPENNPVLNPLQMGASLSGDEKIKLQTLINRFGDVFAVDPKKPRLNKIMKHSIDTQNSLPQFRKPYRIPRAYEDEVNRQLDEMLKNQIIRPSASPWNAPVILVKKKDDTLRFVCDFIYLNNVTKRDIAQYTRHY